MARLHSAWAGGDAAGRPGFFITFPYDEDAIARLKSIHPSLRSYDPARHVWWILDAEEATDVAAEIFPAFRAVLNQPALPGL